MKLFILDKNDNELICVDIKNYLLNNDSTKLRIAVKKILQSIYHAKLSYINKSLSEQDKVFYEADPQITVIDASMIDNNFVARQARPSLSQPNCYDYSTETTSERPQKDDLVVQANYKLHKLHPLVDYYLIKKQFPQRDAKFTEEELKVLAELTNYKGDYEDDGEIEAWCNKRSAPEDEIYKKSLDMFIRKAFEKDNNEEITLSAEELTTLRKKVLTSRNEVSSESTNKHFAQTNTNKMPIPLSEPWPQQAIVMSILLKLEKRIAKKMTYRCTEENTKWLYFPDYVELSQYEITHNHKELKWSNTLYYYMKYYNAKPSSTFFKNLSELTLALATEYNQKHDEKLLDFEIDLNLEGWKRYDDLAGKSVETFRLNGGSRSNSSREAPSNTLGIPDKASSATSSIPTHSTMFSQTPARPSTTIQSSNTAVISTRINNGTVVNIQDGKNVTVNQNNEPCLVM